MLSGDGDVDSLSSDEKSDSEGKMDRMSSSSSSIASSTDTQEVRKDGPWRMGRVCRFFTVVLVREVTSLSVFLSVVQSSRSNPDGGGKEPSDGAE